MSLKQDLLRNVYYLAGVYQRNKKYKKSLLHYKEALRLIKKSDNSKYYPSCLNNMATVLAELNQVEKSMTLRMEAINQIKSVVGHDKAICLTTLKNMAIIYRGQGNYEKSIELLNEVVEAKKMLLGGNARETLIDIVLLIDWYVSDGELEKALKLLMYALDQIDVVNDEFSELLNDLARIFLNLGDINMLNEIYSKALMPPSLPEDEA